MFKVHKTKEFADRIMPCYFKNQTRYKSFQRQLNSYQFHRFDAGKNKGACFHQLFMRDNPDLCTRMCRVKVTRRRPDAAQQQSLLLDDHVPSPLPNVPRLLSSRESSEADVPDDFLCIFNSKEVDPLDCPSVTMFDDEEKAIQLGRTTSPTTTPAPQQENMGYGSEFQDKSNFLFSLFHCEPHQKTNNNALVPQYVQFPRRNKNFDYSVFSRASNNDSTSSSARTNPNGAPAVRDRPQGWPKCFKAQAVFPKENNEAANVFDGASETFHFMENYEF
jgi:hypothetical protein